MNAPAMPFCAWPGTGHRYWSLPGAVAVKVTVPACIPAAVGSPRNHSAEPGKAGAAVIIGIADRAASADVMTSPWAMSASALISSMLTCAPAGTMIEGSVIPAMRNESAGIDGEASTARFTLAVVKVMARAARLMLAAAGTWLPSAVAWAGLTRGPGALANSLPMTVPGSLLPPIMEEGRVPPRIQPGAPVPPFIHWYPAWLIIQPEDEPPIMPALP